MFYIILFLLCAVNSDGVNEGDYCIKEGVTGVCTNIRQCFAAQQDINNRKEPQICNFWGVDPIVCCVLPVTTTTTTTERYNPYVSTYERLKPRGKCVLPPYPNYGTYSTNVVNGKPGDAYDFFVINITCHHDFAVDGSRTVLCQGGWWPEPMPSCVLACRLRPDPSVEYNCVVSDGRVNGTRACEEYEPLGTVVSPRCRPYYYSLTPLGVMRCILGSWNYIAKCSHDCGRVIGDDSQRKGTLAKRGEVPWHAVIYDKTTLEPTRDDIHPYKQICGGSLISHNVVITAALCFWKYTENIRVGSDYTVGVGKLYQAWNDPGDARQAQYSDVKHVYLPPLLQDDIALAAMEEPFEFKPHIQPVCLNFYIPMEIQQLQPGTKGKIAGWGLTSENGMASRQLQIIEMSYISIETCVQKAPPDLLKLINDDKICADYNNDSIPLCNGIGGLAFPQKEKGTTRYYLRGVLSSKLGNNNQCINNSYGIFTQLSKREDFFKKFRQTTELISFDDVFLAHKAQPR